jgi:cellulose synthase/poly-beta-1,6-N-acetylglucosamine synthase-like glycosyltransferase
MQHPYFFSVGICAFNEGENIDNLLNSIVNQSLPKKYHLKEIIVVASGCTDKTEKIVRDSAKKHRKIILISQKQRRGKAVAVNLFLSKVRSNLLILQSADTIADKNCYRYLLNELVKPEVGLAAGQIIPLDTKNSFLGYANHLKWRLHHLINLKFPQRPKVGELIAFKKVFAQIPPETAVDEASVEPLIHLQGFKIVYVPKAIIYNHGPQRLREYLSGRRRIYAGHFVTKKKYAYEVITFNPRRFIPIFFSDLKFEPKSLLFAFLTVTLEILARFVGYLDIQLNLRDHTIWKIAGSSKKLKKK